MDCILENPIISKQLFSYFSLSELGSLSTICKNTRYITKYATFTNGGRIKDIKKKSKDKDNKLFLYIVYNYDKCLSFFDKKIDLNLK